VSTTLGTQTKSYVIFPKGTKWEGVDQRLDEIDPDLYSSFKTFLESYFIEDLNKFWSETKGISDIQDQGFNSGIEKTFVWNTSVRSRPRKSEDEYVDDEDSRAIPGGRYGCA
jgi:hypothetical protein